MTTMRLPFNLSPLDSDSTVVEFLATGQATFQNAVVFASAVTVSGAATLGGSTVFINAITTTLTTAQASSVWASNESQDTTKAKSTGLLQVTINGSVAYIPFLVPGAGIVV